MRLGTIFGAALFLYLIRGPIIAVALFIIGDKIVDTAGLVFQAKVNNAFALVGARGPYLLPPATETEGRREVVVGPVFADSSRRETKDGVQYVFDTTGSITNGSKWTVTQINFTCIYRLNDTADERMLHALRKIEVKPNETQTYHLKIETDQIQDTSGISSLSCKANTSANAWRT